MISVGTTRLPGEQTQARLFIGIRTEFEAAHFWFDAPEEVAFLRAAHRHVFRVKLEMSVQHSDREKEFFLVQGALREFIQEEYLDRSPLPHVGTLPVISESCEVIAEKILIWAVEKYNGGRFPHLRWCRVTVSEDGENFGGAKWKYRGSRHHGQADS